MRKRCRTGTLRGEGRRVAILLPALAAALAAAPAQAQIIDENTQIEQAAPSTDLQLELFTDFKYATNALAISNLSDGLDREGLSDWVWVKGARVSAAHALSANAMLFGVASAAHVSLTDNSGLDFVGASAVVGAEVRPSRGTSLYAGGICTKEMDTDLHGYFSYCGPIAGASARLGSARAFNVEFGLSGRMAMGSRETLARYQEASAYLAFQTGGPVRFRLEPGASVRKFELSDAMNEILGKDRVDYRAEVELSLSYRSRNFEFGVSGQPMVNWSNQLAYRYWDVRGGPFLKVRI